MKPSTEVKKKDPSTLDLNLNKDKEAEISQEKVLHHKASTEVECFQN